MIQEKSLIRTRFAPSPTGSLHIGSLRTALYSYIFARQQNGKFILRLEDTDIERLVEGAAEAIYAGLKWAGLQYDEGPDIGGPFGPYVQSQRVELYKKYAQELIKKDQAYYCFCDKETLEKMRQEQTAKKQAPKYDRRCLKLSAEEIELRLKNNKPHVVRMKIPTDRVVEFEDLVRGKVSYNTNELDDSVLLKSDGFPTYHLAVVVDDHLMQISHVTRTEEWLPSTPKHILLYEYFGWETPQWAHLPLLLNPDKSKISKRKGDVAVEEYIKKGYLPEAMINFLAFLGWNPGTEKEIYSMEELLKDFDLSKVHKAGAIFNIEKLNWYNDYYLNKASPKTYTYQYIFRTSTPASDTKIFTLQDVFHDLLKEICPEIEKKITDKQIDIDKVYEIEKLRGHNLQEMAERACSYLIIKDYNKDLLKWKDTPEKEIKKSLQNLEKIIGEIPEKKFTKENLEKIIMPEAQSLGDRGVMLWPLRAALSGKKASPGPFEIAEILEKEETLARIKKAIEKFG